MIKKKLYLDIDGVLLTSKNPRPAPNVISFISFCIDNFDCYWLTTHCKGNNASAIHYLSPYFDLPTIKKLETVKSTTWTTLKTEAIDFSVDFYWLDDYPLNIEKEILLDNDNLDCLIIVDLNRENELHRIIDILKG